MRLRSNKYKLRRYSELRVHFPFLNKEKLKLKNQSKKSNQD